MWTSFGTHNINDGLSHVNSPKTPTLVVDGLNVAKLIRRIGGYIAVEIVADAGFDVCGGGACCWNLCWLKLSLSIKLLDGAIADGTMESAAAVPVFVPTTLDFRLWPECPEVEAPSSRERRRPSLPKSENGIRNEFECKRAYLHRALPNCLQQ